MLIFSLFTTLHAYSKKIILSSFSNMENAQKSLEEFKKTSSYKQINALEKTNDFKIYPRASGKYFIVVIEPLLSKELGYEVYRLAKQEYKHAYPISYEPPVITPVVEIEETPELEEQIDIENETKPIIEQNETKPIVLEKNETKPIVLEKNETKPVIVPVKKEQEKTVFKVEENQSKDNLTILDYIFYAFLVLLLSVFIFYFIKFKRLYDEY